MRCYFDIIHKHFNLIYWYRYAISKCILKTRVSYGTPILYVHIIILGTLYSLKSIPAKDKY